METGPSPRKILALFIGVIAAFILIPWLWHFYHTGKIIITTSDPYSSITLTKLNSTGAAVSPHFNGRSTLSETVATGNYAASVTNGSVTETQNITLKPRQTARYVINPAKATGVEPVTFEPAQDISASKSQMFFLDNSKDTLQKIDNQNNLTQVSDQQFQTIKWANTSFGVGQDSSGHLYTVVNGVVQPLKVPFSYNGNHAINFDVAPNKEIYVSSAWNVYAGDKNGNFKQVFSAASSKPVLVAESNGVIVADTKYGGKGSNIPKSLLSIVKLSGKKVQKNIEAEQVAVSPDNRYIAVFNQSNPTIYDASLHKIANINTSAAVGHITWLNSTTLLYNVNDQLWSYNVVLRKAQLFANMPFSNSISGVYVDDSGSYVYIATYDSFSYTSAIRRIGLKGQNVPDYIFKLQDILPLNEASYWVGLVNFSSPPVIEVQPHVGATPANYIQMTQSTLKGLGVDPSQLQFKTEQPVEGD